MATRQVFDLLIKGGIIVDGTGAPGFPGDIGVKEGRISAIGELADARASRTIDAEGLVVAPGFIDVHTHYDAQLLWDPIASPSPYHGVTTVIAGLCGFSIQPMTPAAAEYLIPMLSQVEDIPLASLNAAVDCDWQHFGEYRARLEGRIAVNAAFATGHSAIRQVVMGDRATSSPATEADMEAMKALLRRQLEDGAIGFSTSNSATHTDHNGGPVPSRFAAREEFVELSRVAGEYEGTIIEIQPGLDFDDDAADLMAEMSVASDRIVNWNAQFVGSLDDQERDQINRQLAMSDRVRARGGDLVGLSVPVPAGMHMDMRRGVGFVVIPGWQKIFGLPHDERVAALRDPSVRTQLREAAFSEQGRRMQVACMLTDPDFLLVEQGKTERTRALDGKSMREAAQLWNADPFDVMFDIALADDLDTLFTFRNVGADAETYRFRVDLWRDDRMLLGGSDAGAHVETIDTFGYFSRVIEEAVGRHGVLGLEEAVHYLTQAPANLVGLCDRGTLAVGAHADITIFDPAAVRMGKLEHVADLPGGASRLYASAEGFHHVLVNGTPIIEQAEYTGALPGSVLLRGQDTRTVAIPNYVSRPFATSPEASASR